VAKRKKRVVKKVAAAKKPAAAKKKATAKKNAASTKKAASKKQPRPSGGVDFDWAKRAVARYEKEIMALLPKGEITGIGIGRRIKDDKLGSEMTIRIHVASLESKIKLRANPDLQKYYGGLGSDIIVSNIATSSNSRDFPDGAKIFNSAKRRKSGTLGTKVVADVGVIPAVVWLTAAHVASAGKPRSKSVEIFPDDGSGSFGTVSPNDYFRNSEVDAAYVVPSGEEPPRPPLRVMHHPTTDDLGKTVEFDGAQTSDCKGEIVDLYYQGTLTDTNEKISDHLFIRHTADSYAKQGDSGSLVYLEDQAIGILRGADESLKYSAVAKLENLARITTNLGRGFSL
jgi:hypothetical protein